MINTSLVVFTMKWNKNLKYRTMYLTISQRNVSQISFALKFATLDIIYFYWNKKSLIEVKFNPPKNVGY